MHCEYEFSVEDIFKFKYLYYTQYNFYMEQTRIKVVVRKRPLSKKEKVKNDADVLEQRGVQTVAVKEMK